MTRNIILSPKEFYHVYNRGTEKRNIFSTPVDYERFLSLLYICNGDIVVLLKRQGRTLDKVGRIDRGKPLVEICGYCLMPNHFHILLYEIKEDGITRFMQKLMTAYTMYFNKRYKRSGVLFQGKYKAVHAENDAYLCYLLSYIHLNPIKLIDSDWKENGIKNRKKAEKYLNNYRYSSYLDYTGTKRKQSILINKNVFPKYSETPDDFKKSMSFWLDGNVQGRTLDISD